MGLAASQARFLCITARKADCEYKSTDLAQQKLNITNQLASISNDYANSMNATKLMWSNDAVDGDYGLTYSLLMMPSALNDYNPCMITTPSGAIVLNNEYAQAAKAAGLSKAGGIGSQEQRDKFIQALVPGGLITQETANAITVNDYKAQKANGVITFDGGGVGTSGVDWNAFAGLGAQPKNKSTVDAMQLEHLIMSENFGQKSIDWVSLLVNDGQISKAAYDERIKEYGNLEKTIKNNKIDDKVISFLKTRKNSYISENYNIKNFGDAENIADEITKKEYADALEYYDNLIKNAESIKAGKTDNLLKLDGKNPCTQADVFNSIRQELTSQRDAFKRKYSGSVVDINNSNFNFNSSNSKIDFNGYSIVINGVLNKNEGDIKSLNIGDIFTSNIVLVSNSAGSGTPESLEAFKEHIFNLLDSITQVFGYSSEGLNGKGLDVGDEASQKALKFAYDMTKRQFSRVTQTGSNKTTSLLDNTAYQTATNFNTIGADKDSDYVAVSLSNMLSSFLTYYATYIDMLNGNTSDYVVGKSVETSTYVTDNPDYYYIAQDDPGAVTDLTQKSADFYDELYNNILAHGWREDVAIDDSEYLESMIKDGRYAMSSLNADGYYYQTRYNETNYIVEVSDTDAIARAEAEFTAKKAELTYKENSLDLKTKKLDTEISALNSEYEAVKNLISTGVQKTFQMFSQ